jgi:hypothetical protein
MVLDSSEYNNQQTKIKPEIQTNKSLDSCGFMSIDFDMFIDMNYTCRPVTELILHKDIYY